MDFIDLMAGTITKSRVGLFRRGFSFVICRAFYQFVRRVSWEEAFAPIALKAARRSSIFSAWK